MSRARTSPRRNSRKIGPGPSRPAGRPSASSKLKDAPTDVERLTSDILQFHADANRHKVAVRAEIGRLLIELREALPYGSFRPHLKAHLPFTASTAERAMNLHRFRLNQPELFDDLAKVGLAKVAFLIGRPPTEIQALLATKHTVPSTQASKSLLAMTFAEMMEVVAGGAEAPFERSLLRDYRSSARQLMQSLDAMVDEGPGGVDRDDVADLYDDLVQTLHRFADAFDLERAPT